jgi:hypothetical protein
VYRKYWKAIVLLRKPLTAGPSAYTTNYTMHMQPVLASRCYLPNRGASSLRSRNKRAHSLLESREVFTEDLVDFLAVVEKEESWLGVHAKCSGDVEGRVYVEPRKDVFSGHGKVIGVLFHACAGARPGSVGLEDDEGRRGD